MMPTAVEGPKPVEGTDALTQAAILNQLAEGVIVADADGRITLVNAAAERLHGVARLDVEPDAYSDTYHLFREDGRPYPFMELPLVRAVLGETVSQARWRIRRPDGTEILAIGDARPLHDASGRRIGAVLTLRDDTAREAAERGLRELNGVLAETVAVRTAEAVAARREAERASEAKSDFLAAVSHELRTPLHSVLGYAELVSGDLAPGGRPAELVTRIRTAGATLLGLVNDLLDLSRIEAGGLDVVDEPFSLAELAEDSLSMVREAARAKALRLELRTPEQGGHVVGDAFRIRQILVNLLSNAVKFTEAGEVTLEVARAGGRLRFCVHDTGVGVPEAKRHLLFQRFSQVDGTRAREHTGVGLGLAICKRLVERLGGVIGMVGREGGGSTFWFELDLSAAPGRAAPAEPAPASDADASARRVLLVDDVVTNLELGRMMLESAGHRVDVAASGEAAIAAVRDGAYDLVFMDVQMPQMDGLTATRRIRALGGVYRVLPIVALTADVHPHSVLSALSAGMTAHLGKPFTREALLQAVASAAGWNEAHHLRA